MSDARNTLSLSSLVDNRLEMTYPIEIRFSAHLKRFVDLPDVYRTSGSSVRDVIDQLESDFPGVTTYLLHENGKLRQHVNLFLDERMIRDRDRLSDTLDNTKTIFVIQALSGG